LGYFYQQLSHKERDQIALLHAKGWSFAAIARKLRRSASTISREFKRNQSADQEYIPSVVHQQVKQRNKDAKKGYSKCQPYERRIHDLLSLGWTPAQIAGRLTKKIRGFSVSYETIYCFIYQHHMPWAKLLPRKHEPRWYKRMGKKMTKRDMIPNRVSILERPAHIDDKSQFGHWEGDSMVCSQSIESLNVMVERQTQYVSIRRVLNRGPQASKDTMFKSLTRFKKHSRKSITFDNGIEFKYHEKLKAAINIDTYFCQPYSSWEKGLVEQINGLIRRYLPKKTDLSKVKDKEIKLIEYLLNSRPRKLLNWQTPAEVFSKKCRMKLVNGALAV